MKSTVRKRVENQSTQELITKSFVIGAYITTAAYAAVAYIQAI